MFLEIVIARTRHDVLIVLDRARNCMVMRNEHFV
eukprot:COSAG05_NODE_24193_length_253_cov_0.668831_1_plen_33_part_01